MMAIIAVLCSVSFPADCHERTATISDFADVSMQSCLMGARATRRLDESASDRVPLRHGAACIGPAESYAALGRPRGFPALSGSGSCTVRALMLGRCRVRLRYLMGVVSALSLVSRMKTASSFAGSVLLALRLIEWIAPGGSDQLSPAR